MSFREKFEAKYRGERMIPLSSIAQVFGLSMSEKAHLGAMLKEEAAVYWLKKGGEPKDIREGPQHVRALSRAPGPHFSDPEYSQAFLTDLIIRGVLTPMEYFSKPAFAKASPEDLIAAIEKIPAEIPADSKTTGHRSHRTTMLLRAGLGDSTDLGR